MSEKTITCSKCNKIFKRQTSFEKHIKICNGNRCEYCNEIFLDKYYLQKHIQTCVNKYIKENELLKTIIQNNNINISKLEDQINILKNDLQQERKKYTNYYSKYENIFDNLKWNL